MTPERKNRIVALGVFAVVAGMVGLSFAAVPLYSLFCRVTGYGGTTQASAAAPLEVLERQVTVRFNTDIASDLPWTFKPEIPKVTLHVGQDALVTFLAENAGEKTVTGTALYNVTPLKAGKYFNKTQCFCFGEQTLKPGERAHMPVVFYIDPAFDRDPNMADVTTITLSYSFFKADSQKLENALDAFYNTGGALAQ